VNSVCQAPTCTDKVKNGAETDVDCGGPICVRCADKKQCAKAADCTSGVCVSSVCQAATCTDKVKNGAETDVDCGGPTCTTCADGKKCGKAGDCTSGVCDAVSGLCAAPTCTDKVKNGSETDVDCGGSVCSACALGKGCAASADCTKAVCDNKTCRLPISCNEYKQHHASATTGVHTIDPDKGSASNKYSVYCEMSLGGGGWTLVAKVCATDKSDRWTWMHNRWKDSSSFGSYTNLTASDSKSRAYSQVKGTAILIRDLSRTAYAAHTYSPTARTWSSYISSIWSKCGHAVSTSAILLKDDGRDSVIGKALYFRHYDAQLSPCSSQERAMFSEVQKNAGYMEVGLGITEGNATYRDAQSGPSGCTKYGYNVGTRHENYALFVR